MRRAGWFVTLACAWGCTEPAAERPVTRDAGLGGTDTAGAMPVLARDAAARPEVAVGVCVVGQAQACTCAGGIPGMRVCVDPSGTLSECGCLSMNGPDILVPPTPPAVVTCGAQTCAPYTQEETSVSARHCCTTAGTCGSSSAFLFGDACIARGGSPGKPDPRCPDESPNFVDLYGCCRPDGQCGLSIDQVPNFDLGCVERGEMALLLNGGSGQRDFLSLIFFLPITKAVFAPVKCSGS